MYSHVRNDAPGPFTGLELLRTLVRGEQLFPAPAFGTPGGPHLALAGGTALSTVDPALPGGMRRTRTNPTTPRPRDGGPRTAPAPSSATPGSASAPGSGPDGTGSGRGVSSPYPSPGSRASGTGTAAGGNSGSGSGSGSGPGSRPGPGSGPDPEHTAPNPVMALVERAQAGDGEAFGQLYDHYSDTVYRYIYYRVGSRANAEDLTSETFLRALRRIGTFTWQGRDFGAWLVTIARNLVADHFKSSRFRLEVTTGEMLDSNQVEPSPEDSVLELLSNAALLEAVRRLNPQQQECVTLRFLQGLSVAETARIMGKNEGAIKTLQYRAVRTLARLLPSDAR